METGRGGEAIAEPTPLEQHVPGPVAGGAVAAPCRPPRTATGASRRAGQGRSKFHRALRSAPRPHTGPVALRGGRHGAATAPPARGPGTVRANGVGSAMASPPRVMFTLCVHSSVRECHACEHPQRARDPWPEASTSAKSGSVTSDYSRVPPGRAVVVEADRSRVERGRLYVRSHG